MQREVVKGRLEKKELLKSREENPAGRKWLAVLQLRGAERDVNRGTSSKGTRVNALYCDITQILDLHYEQCTQPL